MTVRLAALVLAIGVTALDAASTQTWEMSTWQDFLRGRFRGISLTRDARLVPAPQTSTLFEDGQSSVWCAARAADGSTYFGTGHGGRLIRLDATGKSTVVWTAPEPEIFAVIVDTKGVVYAGTSPGGKVYRIENGKAAEYFQPQSKYIWALAVDASGVLYAGTGDQGKIFRITAPNAGEVWFESGQSHITALAFDRGGNLLAGSDPNGILYRVSGKNKAFVIYDADLPEIRSLMVAPDGRIYVSALGGSIVRRTNAAAAPMANPTISVTAPATAITVEAQGGVDVRPKPEAPKGPTVPPPPVAQQVEITGVEKSAIYRIEGDGSVDTLWSSKEENAYDLALDGTSVYFATDGAGRIYQLDAEQKLRLLAQSNEGDVTRLLTAGNRLIAATANQGRILSFSDVAGASGEYESPVHDAGSISRWGRLDWRFPATGARAAFRARAGNSARPDGTWSDWSAPLSSPGPLSLPAARYVQWKVELEGKQASVDSISLSYRPQNNAPAVRSITVVSQLGPTPPAMKQPVTPSGAAYSITVTDTGDTGASSLSGTSTQNAGRPGTRQLVISWAGEDVDNDTLTYTLSFRGDGEREWKVLKPNLSETTFTLDGDLLADGRYSFRVIASDRASNPPADTRTGELVSSPVRLDNTPPTVTLTRSGEEVVVQAVDATSPLRQCEISLDARPWTVVESEDGITDGTSETFRIRLDSLSAGEHLLTVRVTDAGGNPGLGKLVIQK